MARVYERQPDLRGKSVAAVEREYFQANKAYENAQQRNREAAASGRTWQERQPLRDAENEALNRRADIELLREAFAIRVSDKTAASIKSNTPDYLRYTLQHLADAQRYQRTSEIKYIKAELARYKHGDLEAPKPTPAKPNETLQQRFDRLTQDDRRLEIWMRGPGSRAVGFRSTSADYKRLQDLKDVRYETEQQLRSQRFARDETTRSRGNPIYRALTSGKTVTIRQGNGQVFTVRMRHEPDLPPGVDRHMLTLEARVSGSREWQPQNASRDTAALEMRHWTILPLEAEPPAPTRRSRSRTR